MRCSGTPHLIITPPRRVGRSLQKAVETYGATKRRVSEGRKNRTCFQRSFGRCKGRGFAVLAAADGDSACAITLRFFSAGDDIGRAKFERTCVC